ncbi:MAG: hypothetical protein ACJ739_00010 [Acidimicrobiales bacterium]
MEIAQIDWIPAGTRFGIDEMTWFVGRGERPLDEHLAHVDLIVTGPHASAAFPAEMQPFVDASLTKRLQYDFTDVSTSPVTRRWALDDPHVLYIEDPHPRAVRDANRVRPDDLLPGLREAFARLTAAPDGRPSLAGVDAVRPVTFGYLPVLRQPQSDDDWNRVGEALDKVGALGIDEYERVRDDLIDRVIEAKLRRLAELDPAGCTVAEWRSATHLDVMSMHDTMNHTARPDGAVCLEREPEDRLPAVVALSNHGDATGATDPGDTGALRDPTAVPSMRPQRIRAIARGYQLAFDAWEPDDIAFNRPYKGGYETRCLGPKLRSIEPLAVVRPVGGVTRRLHLGAWQNEFLREFLLGPEAAAKLAEPGTDWAFPPDDRVAWLAERLRYAHDLVRSWGPALIE